MAASMATENAFVPGSDSDYFLDMKSLKTSNGFCQIMDEDYKTFLYALNKYSEEEDLKESALKDEDGDCYMDQQYKIFEEGIEGAVNDEDGDCQIDPHYKMFLDNLREDGKSYILDIPGTVHIKYEGQDNGVSDGNGINWATLKDENKSNLATPRGAYKGDLATPREEEWGTSITPREEDKRKSAIPRAKDRIISTIPSKEDRRNSVTPTEKDWRIAREVPHSKPMVLKAVKTEKLDLVNQESYLLPLNRRKLDDIAADILAKRGKRLKSQNVVGETLLHATKFATNSAVKLEDDDNQTLADTKKFGVTNKLPVNSADVHNPCHAKRTITSGNSHFREKLMEILRMPYNQREYEELLHEITDRKPMQRHRDLRGRIKVYDVDLLGKSYLDYHSDLAKRIDLVECDRPKVLNLLRGFFYWLTNLSHHGAFQPWLDSSSLKMVPQVSASD